jgi:hypothetical protein
MVFQQTLFKSSQNANEIIKEKGILKFCLPGENRIEEKSKIDIL